MKTTSLRTITTVASLIFSLALTVATSRAYAGDETDGAGIPECKAIVAACKLAGYTHEGKDGQKRIWVDCVGAVSQGKKISGVTETKEQARGCRMAQRKARLAAKLKP